MERIDQQLLELKTIEGQIEHLTKQKEEIRKDVFGYIEDNGLTDGYRNDVATVSYVERKTVKIANQDKLIQDLQNQKLTKYYDVVPEQVIPEHVELKSELTKDIKAGTFIHPEIEIDVTNNLSVRFN